MVPRSELSTLRLSIQEAEDLAADGSTYDGWRCLLGGEARAQELVEEAAEGETWQEDLLQLWRRGLTEYAERWGIVER
jgi:hypothetical protein